MQRRRSSVSALQCPMRISIHVRHTIVSVPFGFSPTPFNVIFIFIFLAHTRTSCWASFHITIESMGDGLQRISTRSSNRISRKKTDTKLKSMHIYAIIMNCTILWEKRKNFLCAQIERERAEKTHLSGRIKDAH